MKSLSKSEERQLINLLNKLNPGVLPRDIFFALIRLVVSATYLVVPIFEDKNGKIKVYLIKRETDDPHWPGLLHIPGKIIIPTDTTIKDTYLRLLKTEVPELKIKNNPIFCGYVFDEIPRGKEISLINFVVLKEKPKSGFLYSADKLPKNTISTEVKRIKMAVKHYKLTKTKN